MKHRARLLLLLAAVFGPALPASAGQVRIDVSSNMFVLDDISMNLGDHAVFVWTSGVHNVVSGTVSGGTRFPDGLFDSGGSPLGVGTLSGGGTAFTWKSTASGNRNYYCHPHALQGMTGILRIQASGVAVSDFRITEVQYGAAGNLDRIEITNMGDAAGDLGRYRISISSTATELDIVPVNTLTVPVGGRVTIHTNQTGTNTATSLFMNTIGNLPEAQGSVALYAPYRQSTSIPGPLNTDTMVDFVQWGAAGQPNAGNASDFWNSGEFVAGESAAAYSISFCGSRAQRGASFWSVSTANFGSSGICTTDALNTSWGRIKTLYR